MTMRKRSLRAGLPEEKRGEHHNLRCCPDRLLIFNISGISVQDPNAKKEEDDIDGPNDTVKDLLRKAAA